MGEGRADMWDACAEPNGSITDIDLKCRCFYYYYYYIFYQSTNLLDNIYIIKFIINPQIPIHESLDS